MFRDEQQERVYKKRLASFTDDEIGYLLRNIHLHPSYRNDDFKLVTGCSNSGDISDNTIKIESLKKENEELRLKIENLEYDIEYLKNRHRK